MTAAHEHSARLFRISITHFVFELRKRKWTVDADCFLNDVLAVPDWGFDSYWTEEDFTEEFTRVFFTEGDNAFFQNLFTQALRTLRRDCRAICPSRVGRYWCGVREAWRFANAAGVCEAATASIMIYPARRYSKQLATYEQTIILTEQEQREHLVRGFMKDCDCTAHEKRLITFALQTFASRLARPDIAFTF